MVTGVSEASPRIDIRILLRRPRLQRRQALQAVDNPSPRVCWINHVVDATTNHRVHGLSLLVGLAGAMLEFGAARLRFFDRREFLAIAKLDRALDVHTGKL